MVNDEVGVVLVFAGLSLLGLGSLLLRDFILRLSHKGWRELERMKSRALWPIEIFLGLVIIGLFVSGTGLMVFTFPILFALIALFLTRSGTGGLARDQAWCLHYLSLTAAAGLPLHQALRGIAEDVRGRFGLALWRAAERIELGGQLSEALRTHGVFPPHIVAAIQIAETGGGRLLAPTCKSLKIERQWAAEIHGRLSHRLLLPVASLGFTLCAAAFLSAVIIPKHRDIMRAMNIRGSSMDIIPFISKILMFSTAFVLVGVILYVILASNAPSRFKQSLSDFFTAAFGWLPFGRNPLRDRELMRSLRALAVQLDCNVPVPDALRNVGWVEISGRFVDAFQDAAKLLERGERLSDALRQSGFPESLCAIVACAQSQDQLTMALRSEADWHQQRVQRFDRFVTVLIPVCLVLFVGVVQFGLLWSTFEPINTLRMELVGAFKR